MIIFKTKTPAVKEGVVSALQNIRVKTLKMMPHLSRTILILLVAPEGEQRLVEEGKLCRGLLQNRDPAAASLMKRRQVARREASTPPPVNPQHRSDRDS